MKKTMSLYSLFAFAHVFGAQQAIMNFGPQEIRIQEAIIVAMNEFPVLDGIVKDDLVDKAARKGVVMFVGALADHIYPIQIAKTLGQCNVIISQEARDRAQVLAQGNGYDLNIMAHLLTKSPQSQRSVLSAARFTVNQTVAKYLEDEPLRDDQAPFHEEETQAKIDEILNNQ